LGSEDEGVKEVQMLRKNWIQGLMKQNQGTKATRARARDRKRVKGVNAKAVQPFYKALNKLYCKHCYPPSAVFNMDETGYAIGNVAERCAIMYSGSGAQHKAAIQTSNPCGRWVTTIK
jgi:hypothetical protein